jgi:lipopolysaccharide transport system permease protein
VGDIRQPGAHRLGHSRAFGYHDASRTLIRRKPTTLPSVTHISAASRPTLVGLLNPFTMLRGLAAQRDLIGQLARREVALRYRGSILGLLWSFLIPLLMLVVYTFVFSVVFQARFDEHAPESRVDFALQLFCGLVLYTIFSECVTQAPGVVLANPSYVKKVVFPLEILVPVKLIAALVHGLISLGVLLVAVAVLQRQFSATLAYYPLVLLPLLMLTAGAGWFLASLGVYVRDAAQIVTLLVNVLFFLTPIFYPVHRVPEVFRPAMWVNPLTVIVESGRATVLQDRAPNWPALLLVTLASGVVMQLGYAWFMKTKRGFADVL